MLFYVAIILANKYSIVNDMQMYLVIWSLTELLFLDKKENNDHRNVCQQQSDKWQYALYYY